MERLLYSDGFVRLLKILHVILNIMFVMFIVAIGLLVVGAGIIYFGPEDSFRGFIEGSDLTTTLSVADSISVTLSGHVPDDISMVKDYIMVLLGIYSLAIGMGMYFVVYVRKFIRTTMNKSPFCYENVGYIKKVGIGLIVLGFVGSTLKSALGYVMGKLVGLDTLLFSTDWVKRVEFDIFGLNSSFLLSGILILIIAKIFKYGVDLKEEHDATV